MRAIAERALGDFVEFACAETADLGIGALVRLALVHEAQRLVIRPILEVRSVTEGLGLRHAAGAPEVLLPFLKLDLGRFVAALYWKSAVGLLQGAVGHGASGYI